MHIFIDPGRSTAPHEVLTNRRHVFELEAPPDYYIELAIDPADSRAENMAFTLESTDGSYRCKKTVRDDLQPDDRTTLLCFERVLPGKRYSLFIHGAGASGYHAFKDCSYDMLMG